MQFRLKKKMYYSSSSTKVKTHCFPERAYFLRINISSVQIVVQINGQVDKRRVQLTDSNALLIENALE